MTDWTVIASARAAHQVTHQGVMAEGLEAHGYKVRKTPHASGIQTKNVACWGWRVGKILRAQGHNVLVMERGYLGDRFAWTSLNWNGLNNRGHVGEIPEDWGDRFNRHFELKPWNPEGAYELLIGQVPGDMSLQGKDLYPWYCAKAKNAEGKMHFRPHPLASRRGPIRYVPGAPRLDGPLETALANASKVITYNSNTGVDALVNGKPVTVDDIGSMAWDWVQGMDRETWAHRLAWRQWTIEEIKSGFALEIVGLG